MDIEKPSPLWITVQKRMEEIDAEIDRLNNILEEKDKTWDFQKPFEEYQKMRQPESRQISVLDRERRLIMPYELSELSDFGDVMPLSEFISACKDGLFINYDGFGRYVKDDKETDIEIYPSDIKHNSVRKDFDTMIWFNR